MEMGRMREQAVGLLNNAKMQPDATAKSGLLKNLKEMVLYRDPALLPEFVPYLMEFQAERSGPIRKFLAELIEEIGLKYAEHLPVMVPALLLLLQDETPAVVRRAITSGTKLFRKTLEQVALQGIRTGHVEKWLEESWMWITRLKDALCPLAFQIANDGVRVHALKFLETTIMLFTPDPDGSSQASNMRETVDGGFNIAWIVGGHPLLDAVALGQEASGNLGQLLNLLRKPEVSKLSSMVIIVLVNSLATISQQRPSLYGRIVPTLIMLGSQFDSIMGADFSIVRNTLKKAFTSLLKCTHLGATPWKDRLVSILRSIETGEGQHQEPGVQGAPSTIVTSLGVESHKRAFQHDATKSVDNMDGAATASKRACAVSSSSTGAATVAPSSEAPSISDADGGGGGGGGAPPSVSNGNSSHFQQMIAMIVSFVAEGKQTAPAVDLLLSRVAPDRLADVVIENMQNFPDIPPVASSDDDSIDINIGVILASAMGGRTLFADVNQLVLTTPSTSAVVPETQIKPQPQGNELSLSPSRASKLSEVKMEVGEGLIMSKGKDLNEVSQINHILGICESTSVKVEEEHIDEPATSNVVPPISQPSIITQTQNANANLFVTFGQSTSMASTVVPGSIESLGKSSETASVMLMPVLGGMDSVHKSSEIAWPCLPQVNEPVSSLAEIVPVSLKEPLNVSAVLPTTIAVQPPLIQFSPVPVLNLSEEQRASVSLSATSRILEGLKQINAAGGSELRLALLSRLFSQGALRSDKDAEILGVLQKYILSDYHNYKGHDLAIHTLYQLYAEERLNVDGLNDFLNTDTDYERFLLSLVQGLRDNLPPSDKSLGRLLAEAPVLPMTVLKLLEALCNPERGESDVIEPQSVDRVTQGLSTLWNLILLRPPLRAACLEIALQCTIHEKEEVQSKAIRLVANKLFPLTYASQKVEVFATKMLHLVLDADGQEGDVKAFEDVPHYEQVWTTLARICLLDHTSGIFIPILQQLKSSSVNMGDAMRFMSLYFALCTKKHSLLQHLFSLYTQAPNGARQAVHKQIPILIRTIGGSSDLLQIISDPPAGSKDVILQVVSTLAESSTPTPELVASVKHLYENKIQDAEILIPILSSLSKDEVLPIFPRLVHLPPESFKAALDRILQGSAHGGAALTPAEVLIAIHKIEHGQDPATLTKMKDACLICFQQRTVFTQQVLAKVLNQLVEQTPLPVLFMRTVIQAVGGFRALTSFVMEILSRLVSKQIWKTPNLWVGFLKCAEQTQPHSYSVLLQLPAQQLEKALQKHPKFRNPLTAYASQPNIRSNLPRSTQVLLGLAQDAQPMDSSTSTQMPQEDSTPLAALAETS